MFKFRTHYSYPEDILPTDIVDKFSDFDTDVDMYTVYRYPGITTRKDALYVHRSYSIDQELSRLEYELHDRMNSYVQVRVDEFPNIRRWSTFKVEEGGDTYSTVEDIDTSNEYWEVFSTSEHLEYEDVKIKRPDTIFINADFGSFL